MQEGWITAPIPENEAKRLEALYRYNILDTLPHDAFDRITRLASSILKTPIALVSLVDKDRQWFKSRHGIQATQTPRELAFCAHAILKDEVFLVKDASQDPRFFGNPLVSGAPDIRFYAGAPLTTPDGYKIGTLCVIDQEAHNNFDEHERAILTDMAAMVIDEMEFHLAVQKEKIANQAKSGFLANMSHEIRTPMNGVLGVAGLLLDTNLSLKQRELVEVIRKSGDLLLDIVNDILDVSKIEAGELHLESVNFNLHNAVEDIVNLLSVKANEQEVTLNIKYIGEVPEFYIGDIGRVRQIILNLMSNSIKFTQKGNVILTIRHEDLSGRAAKLFFTVVDNGIGIPADKLDYIFNKFTQAEESTTRKFGGTGLGLAICKNLTKMMDGSIGVKSVFGQGSEFYFDITLPYGEYIENNSVRSDNITMFPNLRVLVVDDMKLNMLLLVKILEKHGCIVDTAANGLEALHAVKSFQYHMIFMDCHMPLMDGYEATKNIRLIEQETGSNLPIIAITADAMKGNEQRCLASGMSDYLNKPVKERQIEHMLQKWSGRYKNILHGKRILVAEDNQVNQMVISAILENLGCVADIAEDGLIAVKKAEETKYDAIFMDFQLPNLSGLEAIKIITSANGKNSKTPIIAMSATATEDLKKEYAGQLENISNFLPKPINKEQLIVVLGQATVEKVQIK